MNIPKTYLSCDDVADAIRSLALFYGVEERKIWDLYEGSWPDFLSEDMNFCELIDEWLAWVMGQVIGASGMNYSLPTCFYHRSRYDGDLQWFSAGLLNNQEGARAFLSNIRNFVPDNSVHEAEMVMLGDISSRDKRQEHAGPYAFDFLSHAKGTCRSGLDYSVPEFLMGECWSGKEPLVEEIRQCCQQHLVPVVVKFIGKPQSMDLYISHLWLYLHSQKYSVEYDDPCHYSFNGGGRSVPPENIVELIRI